MLKKVAFEIDLVSLGKIQKKAPFYDLHTPFALAKLCWPVFVAVLGALLSGLVGGLRRCQLAEEPTDSILPVGHRV